MLIIGIKRLNMYYSKEMIIYITQNQFGKNGSGTSYLKVCNIFNHHGMFNQLLKGL
jgi:hypothetical protein